jgi:hypothetical protein
VIQSVDGVDFAADVVFLYTAKEVLDCGMFLIAAKDIFGLFLPVHLLVLPSCLSSGLVLVWLVDVLDRDDGQVAVVSEVSERNASTRLHTELVNSLLRCIKCDGNAEEVAIREPAVADDSGRRLACVCN